MFKESLKVPISYISLAARDLRSRGVATSYQPIALNYLEGSEVMKRNAGTRDIPVQVAPVSQ